MDGEDNLEAFVRKLPKTETHLHLEGALTLALARQIAPELSNTTPAGWATDFRYRDFDEFEAFFSRCVFPWFSSLERYYQAAQAAFDELMVQNVRYLEISFHLGNADLIGCTGQHVAQAIRAACPPALELRVFAGMRRRDYHGNQARSIDACLGWPEVAGIDLHGHETWPLQPWTREVWKNARAAGKLTKAHAGEFGGPENVRQAVEELGVNRVEHGVRAVEDPAVVDLLAREKVTLDVCPISNVKLGVARSMAEHPLRRLLAAGVRCTVNSDDPIAFGNRVMDDYLTLARDGGMTRKELVQLARNGFEVADVAVAQRAAWIEELTRFSALSEKDAD